MKERPGSFKVKGTHWPEEPPGKKKEIVRMWRVWVISLLQTESLRATGFFKSAFGRSQLVCMEHRVSMKLKSSLMGSLSIKARLFKMTQSIRSKFSLPRQEG